jgi:hypothetical protein
MKYEIQIINGGRVIHGVEAACSDDAAAINLTYFYIGLYACDAARLYRGEHTNPRDPETFMMEILSPMTEKETLLLYRDRRASQ